MQNEFERQVQQKMEELDLVPSPPVWEKIEAQIREKTDRRRFVLWFLLLFVLLGGGAFWLTRPDTDRIAATKTSSPDQPVENKPTTLPSKSIAAETIESKATEKNTTTTTTEKKSQTEKSNQEIILTQKQNTSSPKGKSTHQKNIPVSNTSLADIPQRPKENKQTKQDEVKQARSNELNNNKAVVTATDLSSDTKPSVPSEIKKPGSAPDQKNNAPLKKPVDTASGKKTIPVNAVVVNDGGKTKEMLEENMLPQKDSSNETSTVAIVTPKIKTSRWQYGFTASAGVSGLGNGLTFTELFGVEKAFMDFNRSFATSAPIPLARNYSEPAVVRKNLSFSLGAVVKRVIGKRTELSSGLQYDYYSTLLSSGKRDSQRISFGSPNNAPQQSFIAVTAFRNYHNKFHFISLPFNFHFRLFKKAPVSLHTGLTVQQLVSTNAIEYNSQNQLYQSNKSGYNKTQLFSSFGLDYTIAAKRSSWVIGPELRYGLSKHENNGASHHMYSVGMKAQMLFQKK